MGDHEVLAVADGLDGQDRQDRPEGLDVASKKKSIAWQIWTCLCLGECNLRTELEEEVQEAEAEEDPREQQMLVI